MSSRLSFRLTGIYALVVLFRASLIKYVATGPHQDALAYEVEACKKAWYRNILYFNNYFPSDNPMKYTTVSKTLISSLHGIS